ncbi:glycerol-3-phosphate mitochondrial precursor [Stemphylium lycopersici]|nr:glycerol-3-phosphate mitochondrial precursor [Stemphylium lycopersici]RAR11555.1 glycerol-3-phosphate mitochondrial precursor [Stemphylium lycopersici]
MHALSLLLLQAGSTVAFPWVAGQPGVNSALFRNTHAVEKRQADCPFNPVHKGAAPYVAPYTYTGAKNGIPGSQKGGIKVPADGDKAHAFTPPGPNDIRGPCPGLNAAANHNFLSHDGITNFQELVDAQQNVYNVGYDLSVLLAVLGIQAGGDVLSGRLSIGCDATSRTATLPILGRQPGLNGHNKFESDSSLTRNDFFLANGDDYSFNGTLFAQMKSVADEVSGGKFDINALARYRSMRYDDSVAQNPNFFFGPLSVLLYGAASFLYELFPSYGNKGVPDLATMKSFFGAVEDSSAPGGWRHVPERIPDNWFSRVEPYNNQDVTNEILSMYIKYPKLFGGNVGKDNFDALSTPFSIITDGKLPDDADAGDLLCLLYQLGVSAVPSSVSTITDITGALLNFGVGKLNPVFKNSGCPLKVG